MKKPLQSKSKSGESLKVKSSPLNRSFVWITIIVVLTAVVYHSVSSFQITNWDDKAYLRETPMIRDLNMQNLKTIFSEKILKSYNPIVLLSFAIDYKFAKYDAAWYHNVNLFFHILNALLVFVCMRKLKFKTMYAGIIALLFSIHPLATEAVAWIAGRKDVVYLFFFLLSWIFYIDYYNSRKRIYVLLSLLFFVFSLMSKVQAITLPFILIATDLMLDQKFEFKRLTNKIPYFILSIVFGLIAISGSGELVADKYAPSLSLFEKLIYSIMAFGVYIVKIVVPFDQSAVYQFPASGSSEFILDLIIGILLTGFLVIGFFLSLKKNPRLAAGLLFFAVAIFPVLHLVAVNSALIYERFVYLADIGLFIALFAFIEKSNLLEKKFVIGTIAICIVFSALTFARLPVWRNSLSLWTDVITKDNTSSLAYINRGQYYDQNGELDKAFSDFSEAIKLGPENPAGYQNRAVMYFKMKNLKNALSDSKNALRLDSSDVDVLVNHGDIFLNMNEYDSAIFYYKKGISVNNNFAKAYFDCGSAYFKKEDFKSAVEYYQLAIKIIPDYSDAYAYLSLAYINQGNYQAAELAVLSSERYTPNSAARKLLSDELIRLGNRAFIDKDAGKALRLYEQAAQILPSNAEAYFNQGGIYFSEKNYSKAKENWQKALSVNPEYQDAKMWLERTASMK